MPLDDNELLNLATSRLAYSETGDARRLLHEHGDVYRAQLVVARWFEGYRLRRLDLSDIWPDGHSDDYKAGFDEATRDLVARLRQGDLLPGGVLYEEEVRSTSIGLEPVRWEVRAAGDDDRKTFRDRAAASVYASEVHARRPHVRVLTTGFTEGGVPCEADASPPRVGDGACAFIAMTERNGGRWEFDERDALAGTRKLSCASAVLYRGCSQWTGEGPTLNDAVLQVRERFFTDNSRVDGE